MHYKHRPGLAGEVKKHNIINYELTQVIEEVDFITDDSQQREASQAKPIWWSAKLFKTST